MTELLIADPPHEPGDVIGAAEVLGLAVAELRLKINYAIPEVWFSDEKPARLDEAAGVLGAAGLRIARVPAKALAAVPEATTALHAGVDGDGLTLSTQARRATLDPARAAVLIMFTAQEPVPVEAPPPHVDPFWFAQGLQRWRVSAGTTHIKDGGGPHLKDLQRLVNDCDAALPAVTIDRRPTHMKLRRRWRRGPIPTGAPQRKGYSYASPGLDALLASIQPGLEEIDQAELTFRLTFLTWGARM